MGRKFLFYILFFELAACFIFSVVLFTEKNVPVPVGANAGRSVSQTVDLFPASGTTSAPASSPSTFWEHYTLAQVSAHATEQSCWSVVRENVYDLTEWISQHPGGKQTILGMCGVDSTAAFVAQHGGIPSPENELGALQIGVINQ
ncbi:MAG: cytochrome b5 domain-containing protein [bacterium]|nr:cytochrome b5 domain-containing protein [bacterium]